MFPVYPHAVAGEEKIKTGYRHQPRRGAHCAPACHFYEMFCLWADASIGPCAGSYPQGTSKFLINLLHHPPQGFGTVKTVPYRVFYNAWQALKCAVGRGALTTPQPCPAVHYKICDNPHTGPCRIFCIIIHHKLPHGHPLQNTKNPPHARL